MGPVLGQLLTLFRQYAREHLHLSTPGFRLTDEAGVAFGRVERISIQRQRLVVEGWTDASQVTLSLGGDRRATVPSLPRSDVHASHPQVRATNPGFRIDIPYLPGPVFIAFDLGARQYIYPVDPFRGPERVKAEAWLAPRYLWALARGLPAYARWQFSQDQDARLRLKQVLGLGLHPGSEPSARLMPSLLMDGTAPPPAAPGQSVTIILPVHNAFDVVTEALDRVARHTDVAWHLILIEDASTDPRIRPHLRDWAAAQVPGRVELIENQANLGFIGSVNLGFARAVPRGDHVILLNSDALVPEAWASRLLRPILDAPRKVASVTPMSNDAEILSVPVIGTRSTLTPGEAAAIDAEARRFDPAAALCPIPTGIGFCMAMNIAFLRADPAFDTDFGRGYGEEVDWCWKARAAGGEHLAHGGLFVEHRGGTSFGSRDKLKLVARNNAVISARYPAHDGEVRAFLGTDPMTTARLALAVAGAAARAGDLPVPLYIAHALGGGAEDYLQKRIARDLAAEAQGPRAALVLRVGTADRWRLELHAPQGIVGGATDDFALIRRILQPVRSLHMVYSCGVGDRDPIDLATRLTSLIARPQDRAEALFHDYLPISPSYTLLDARGVFRGVPPKDSTDRAHQFRRPDGSLADLASWQAAWAAFLAACGRIVTFSENSRRLVETAFPETAARIVVEPHELFTDLPRAVRPPRSARPVVGILGNIGHPKGAGVVSDLSRSLARSGVADLVLIGNIDPRFPLARQTRVHGTYARRDIPDLVARYGISCWLIPSIWPETFSYTTHECIATGLPVWSFDLGAQGDAVRAAAALSGEGGTLTLDDGEPVVEELMKRILRVSDASRAIPGDRKKIYV